MFYGAPPMWIAAFVASLAIAIPYFAISFFIARGLVRQRQLRTNPLGVGTAMIFFSCAVGHWLHGLHLLEGREFRDAVDPHMVAWDLSTAAIALWYVSMRRRYGQLLHGPAMFDDPTRSEEEQRARHAATHDHLTGLANRAALQTTLADRLAGDAAAGDACVIFLDLDGFKDVNDRLGHHSGDELLQAAARRLRESLRPADVLARIGGDEFVVLLGGAATPSGATVVVGRLVASLHAPFVVADREVRVTASAGVAIGRPGTTTADRLLRDADAAMYRAKQGGGNRHDLAPDGDPRP